MKEELAKIEENLIKINFGEVHKENISRMILENLILVRELKSYITALEETLKANDK